MGLFRRNKSTPAPLMNNQAQAEADYLASTTYVACGARISGGGGEYYHDVNDVAIAILVAFVRTYGDPTASYGNRPAWEGYAYLTPRPDGRVDIVANGVVMDEVAPGSGITGDRVPVKVKVDRFDWQSGEWWNVTVSGRATRAEAKKAAAVERSAERAGQDDELRVRLVSMRDGGMTLQAIADAMTAEGIPTSRGGKWHPATVSNLMKSGDDLPPPPPAP